MRKTLMINSKSHIESRANRRFRRLALNTVIVLYLLIIAGGVVRSTGSGMGCPDWPKCFGTWVPPTEAGQLPANYQEVYGEKLKGEVVFNPVKTWTEYINRLLGAFTGLMIFATLLSSLPFLNAGPKKIFYYSLLAFLLVGFQGWLGAKVVSFELAPVVVTLHMLLAIVIVFLLLYLFTWAKFQSSAQSTFKTPERSGIAGWGVAVLTLSLIQILLGTQVRESMDVVISRIGYEQRESWINALGAEFYVHRSFSILVLIVNVIWITKVLKGDNANSLLKQLAICCGIVIGLELISGIVMAYLGVPPLTQPLHLVLAILLIGLQFVVWLLNGRKFIINASQKDAGISLNG